MARGIALVTDVSGYVLAADGSVHPFGGAPPVQEETTWPRWRAARAFSLAQSGDGVVLDGYGGRHPFGLT
jgi:hypothetical protein